MDMKVDTSFPLFSLYSIWYYFRLVTSSMPAAFIILCFRFLLFKLRSSFHEKYYIPQNLHPEKNQKHRRANAVDSF